MNLSHYIAAAIRARREGIGMWLHQLHPAIRYTFCHSYEDVIGLQIIANNLGCTVTDIVRDAEAAMAVEEG